MFCAYHETFTGVFLEFDSFIKVTCITWIQSQLLGKSWVIPNPHWFISHYRFVQTRYCEKEFAVEDHSFCLYIRFCLICQDCFMKIASKWKNSYDSLAIRKGFWIWEFTVRSFTLLACLHYTIEQWWRTKTGWSLPTKAMVFWFCVYRNFHEAILSSRSVGEIKKKSKSTISFIPHGNLKEQAVGQNKNKKEFNDLEDSISLSAIKYWIEFRQKFVNNIFVICTVCASRKVVCHFCRTIGCWVTHNWVGGR